MRHIFIAGLPGTGKTTFGEWLQKSKGFFHLDMEGRLRSIQPLYSTWQRANDPASFSVFAKEMEKLSSRVVMTWGFPPHAIDLARGIRNLGISCWWFDAPVESARQKWLARERHEDDRYFRSQCAQIEAAKGEIDELFRPNFLTVIDADGTFLAPETISDAMKISG